MNLKIKDQYEGQIEFSNYGNASINIEDKKVFIHKKNTLNSLHLDEVVVEIIESNKKYEAKVLKVKSRFRKEFVGRVQIGQKSTFVVPDSDKLSVDFYIKGGLVAKNGQKVIVELTKWQDTKSPQGKIVKILGEAGENNTEMNSIMCEYNLPVEFPQSVINESELVPEVIFDNEIKKRRDLRNITTFTIDPLDARDFDDALSVNIIGEDNIEIGIHIADVSHYVKVGSELDKEAYKRATSVYLVDRCVPMLPERLSNGICSLKPNEDRLAFSVIINMNRKGKILKEWHGKTIIHSNRRFTYEEAQQVIEGYDGEFKNEILLLNNLAKILRSERIKNGSIEMGGIEVRFKLDELTKKPVGVTFKEQKEANKLIEEFMLLANKSVAKLISDNKRVGVYRIHDTPNQEKIIELMRICNTFGHSIRLEGDSKQIKESINQLLSDIKGLPEENMISTLVVRTMSKATYTTDNIGHYGLGFTHYSHFTSPIRRYPDLMTHRILFDFLSNIKQKSDKIEDECKWCSNRELVASKAQRDSIKYKQAEYLSDKIGQKFYGVVSGIVDWGIYVELIETKCEGLVRFTKADRPRVDLENYIVIFDSGEKVRLGDIVEVSVDSVDLEKKQIDFSLF